MKHFNRRMAEDAADIAGIACLVGAGWELNQILGLALTGVGCLVASWVVGR